MKDVLTLGSTLNRGHAAAGAFIGPGSPGDRGHCAAPLASYGRRCCEVAAAQFIPEITLKDCARECAAGLRHDACGIEEACAILGRVEQRRPHRGDVTRAHATASVFEYPGRVEDESKRR